MFITRKRFQEEIERAKMQAFDEAGRMQDIDNRFRWVHERIDRLEKTLYDMQTYMGKSEKNETDCCTPVRG